MSFRSILCMRSTQVVIMRENVFWGRPETARLLNSICTHYNTPTMYVNAYKVMYTTCTRKHVHINK